MKIVLHIKHFSRLVDISLSCARVSFKKLTSLIVSLLMSFEVEGEVVGARKAAVTMPALERLGPRVLAVVAGELVAAREAPLAPLPRATVRLLP